MFWFFCVLFVYSQLCGYVIHHSWNLYVFSIRVMPYQFKVISYDTDRLHSHIQPPPPPLSRYLPIPSSCCHTRASFDATWKVLLIWTGSLTQKQMEINTRSNINVIIYTLSPLRTHKQKWPFMSWVNWRPVWSHRYIFRSELFPFVQFYVHNGKNVCWIQCIHWRSLRYVLF